MRAICRIAPNRVELRHISAPSVTSDHIVVKASACGINPGDKAWIAGLFPEIPSSQADVCGACASGVVVKVGEGAPRSWLGRKIALYRSLQASKDCLGVWSEFSRVHHLNCVVLPDAVDERDYSASLVSAVTAAAFVDAITEAGHRAVLCTAGTSATGRALLGVCLARNIPLVSIVRTDEGRQALLALDARQVLVSDSLNFETDLAKLAAALNTTAVFDGVGGGLIGRVARSLPPDATIYSYGFLGGNESLGFPSSLLLVKSLTLTSFSVLRPLVRDTAALMRLLAGVEDVIGMPHFRTAAGRVFPFEQATEALAWQGNGKAVLTP